MKKLSFIALLLSIFTFTSCEKESNDTDTQDSEQTVVSLDSQQAASPGYTLIFEDNFNAGSSLSTNWNVTNGRDDYNSDICGYRSSQSKIVKHGTANCLRLEAKPSGGEFISGHVKSKKSFHPAKNEQIKVKGRIKLVARQTVNRRDRRGRLLRNRNGQILTQTINRNFKDTNGAWPAFWTVNETSWPTQGEYDIMEGYSFGGSEHFSSNLFYGTNIGSNDVGRNAERGYSSFSGNGWHTYEMVWTNRNGSISARMKVDNRIITTYKDSDSRLWDFSKFTNHNLIMNLNVGSNDGIFQGSMELFDRVYMYVDWVKVEKKRL